jgi:hypothetical protein
MSAPYADIKQQLQDAIWPEALNQKVWRDLVSTPPHWVKRAADGTLPLANLVSLYWQKVEIYATAPWSKSKERAGKPDERLEALALIAAIEAPQLLPELAAWRQRLLGNQLLAPSDVPAWMRLQAKREGEPAEEYVLYPYSFEAQGQHPGADLLGSLILRDREGLADWLRAEAERIEQAEEGELPSIVREPTLEISCAAPGKRAVGIAIRRDGELARLKAITRQLGLFLKWSEPEAVAFVLSGLEPTLPPWRLTYAEAALPALRRLTLEIDPRMSGAELARLYNRARAGLRSGRDKPMSEKHLALAVFVATGHRSGSSWQTLREEWNRLVRAEDSELSQSYAYKIEGDPTARRFGLDCRTAWTRLTGQRWPGLAPQLTEKRKAQIMEAVDATLTAWLAQHDHEEREAE